MADFINTIDTLGDDAVFDSIINGTITEFKDDAVAKVGGYTFANCAALNSVSLTNCEVIGEYAFQYCSDLTTANFPAATSVGKSAFNGCSKLTSVNIPLATSIGSSVFDECKKLTSVKFLLAKSVSSYAFFGCTELTSAEFAAVKSFGSSVFASCTALKTLILRNATRVTLSTTGAFTNTPITSGKGYIYVPSALIDSYKAAVNWSTFAKQFRKLEEWTVDGTVTGELIADAANKHLVRFFNSDGTALGYTHVATGGNATYSGTTPVDPAGENPFVGFVPAPENVTEDIDCYAIFKDEWVAVFASIAAGTYATDYAIGDTVPLDLGTKGVINMQIIAFDKDDLADGSGKAHITWIAKELLLETRRFNPSLEQNSDGTYKDGTGGIGGWEKSEMRAYLKKTIKPLLTPSLRNGIVEVVNSQNALDNNETSFNQETVDDLWLPSAYDYAPSGKHKGNMTSDVERTKAKADGSYISSYWTRNVYIAGGDHSNSVIYNYNGGTTNEMVARTNSGTCLCFCT